ncbi:MAG: lytic transglycosylase [Thermomicrobiales bacterium]|nr:MAG: lytic transglycosylase [Thermomicrobiales bacterium]
MDSLRIRAVVLRVVGCVALIGLSDASATSIAEATSAGHDGQAEQLDQALAYEHGEGVAKDERKAFQIYCGLARNGNAEALFSLGWMFANGRGIPRDDSVASVLIARAAEGGHEHAIKIRQHFSASTANLPECLMPQASEALEFVDSDALLTKEPDLPLAAPRRIVELIQSLAPEYRVHPHLALAVIKSESNFDPNARSPKNAQGLMQLIPETAERFNVRKPFDPEQNIRGGLAYLRWLLAYFRGNVELVAAGYNAGEGAVDRYRGVPPYPETKVYVRRILALYRSESHPYDLRFLGRSTVTSPALENRSKSRR